MAKNRGVLLAAAGRVFRELGYAGASLDAIADEAGFSKGAVYSHFASKADLFLTLLESRIEERAAQQLRVAAEGFAGDGPRAFVEHVFVASRADPQWRLAVLEFRVVAARDAELRERYSRVHQRTVDGVAEALRVLFTTLGIEPDLPVDSLAVAALILDAGGFLEDIASPGVISQHDAVTLFTRLLGIHPNASDQSRER